VVITVWSISRGGKKGAKKREGEGVVDDAEGGKSKREKKKSRRHPARTWSTLA